MACAQKQSDLQASPYHGMGAGGKWACKNSGEFLE